MQTKNLYKYEREPNKWTTSLEQPTGVEYTIMYRLVADEGKAITNGETTTECVDVESAEGWTDCDIPEPQDPDATEEDYQSALEELGVNLDEEE